MICIPQLLSHSVNWMPCPKWIHYLVYQYFVDTKPNGDSQLVRIVVWSPFNFSNKQARIVIMPILPLNFHIEAFTTLYNSSCFDCKVTYLTLAYHTHPPTYLTQILTSNFNPEVRQLFLLATLNLSHRMVNKCWKEFDICQFEISNKD